LYLVASIDQLTAGHAFLMPRPAADASYAAAHDDDLAGTDARVSVLRSPAAVDSLSRYHSAHNSSILSGSGGDDSDTNSLLSSSTPITSDEECPPRESVLYESPPAFHPHPVQQQSNSCAHFDLDQENQGPTLMAGAQAEAATDDSRENKQLAARMKMVRFLSSILICLHDLAQLSHTFSAAAATRCSGCHTGTAVLVAVMWMMNKSALMFSRLQADQVQYTLQATRHWPPITHRT
jgi:hypothetical protein